MKRVPWTGTGTTDDPRRPSLPEGVGFSVVEDHGDGTVTVDVQGGPSEAEERLDALIERLSSATSLAEVRSAAAASKRPTETLARNP